MKSWIYQRDSLGDTVQVEGKPLRRASAVQYVSGHDSFNNFAATAGVGIFVAEHTGTSLNRSLQQARRSVR